MVVFGVAVVLYSLVYLVFAFVPPPPFLRSFFLVPAIFGFLPDNVARVVGRVFVAVCGFFLAGLLFRSFHF